jgi:hypothetical protein
LDWNSWSIREQTELTLECFPDLPKDRSDRVIGEWIKGEYDDNWHGHQRAQADLLKMLRYESMSEEQRIQDKQRQRIAK